MLQETFLGIDHLDAWAHLNNVKFNGVKVSSTFTERGSVLIATRQLSDENPILLTVPRELVLSLENVWVYAKCDKHLTQVLEAVGDWAKVLRTADTWVTHNATQGQIGVKNPFSQYVKYLPEEFSIPTFWNEDERALLEGTSLDAALNSKLQSLEREFEHLHDTTRAIPWCNRHWWDGEEGELSLDNWKFVDAAYRSRALDLPGTGHATVPCIDMANHASGENTVALYETDADGNAILLLRDGRRISVGDEVSITYGDDKGACEMLFSYGFIEDGTRSAKELFLSLNAMNDDPLGTAKKVASKAPPGFRLYKRDTHIDWESDFVWLLCINEEDGLAIKVAQSHDGERELQMSWKERSLVSSASIREMLQVEPNWDVFQLRAIAILQARVEEQLRGLKDSEERVQAIQQDGEIRAEREGYAIELRDLEQSLLLEGYEAFEESKRVLLQSHVVQKYLGLGAQEEATGPEDDFA
ncbi:uncharacterized protein KY384_008214 [Bacidia gigantensis]|uniref:uncharacterized protein n=1 Tax=Bacidia gigantensis TaxID=2732470 RepID=UPI001D043337|nr:uncharacterized protein KY384_008214 [Bacidia gigantensis]KAG8526785.1 hypothetical protein KY384_008214 [Bacidia gigantensis]